MARSITAEDLIAGLLDYDVVTEEQLIRILGAARENITLNALELAIANSHLITDDRLLEVKGTLAGYNILDRHDIVVRPTLSSDAAVRTGSLVLELPLLTVAMVEPTTDIIDAVAGILGTRDFAIWLTTASNFALLYKAAYQHDQSAKVRPQPKNIYAVMTDGVNRNASDIHLSVGQPPIIRQDGQLVRLNYGTISDDWMSQEILSLLGPERLATLDDNYDIDIAFTFGASRFRVNIGADRMGPTIALRKIPVKIPTLDELDLPNSARNLCNLERGLVLITGPTGSGKSTTLASMLASIAATKQRHIITLEDPIEYHIPSGRSVVNQRELYESFSSFPHGLRQALRQDPDVILVGELRDLETIRTALTAAETGHLVFGTLHTYDAVATVSRLTSVFPAEEQDHARAQLAYILKGIISQTLLRTATTKGRVAAFEVMLSTPAIQANLRKTDGHHQLRQAMEIARKDGMQTMEISLVDLVRRGLVRAEDAEFASPDRESFRRRLQTPSA
jgi:twitching motility protein PilT